VRRLVGRWTASASYSIGLSMMTTPSAIASFRGFEFRYPSQADRRQVLDLTGMLRVGSAWRVGAAFTATTGAPYSRFILGPAACDSTTVTCPVGDSTANRIEAPNAHRSMGYASLDALVDWSKTVG